MTCQDGAMVSICENAIEKLNGGVSSDRGHVPKEPYSVKTQRLSNTNVVSKMLKVSNVLLECTK